MLYFKNKDGEATTNPNTPSSNNKANNNNVINTSIGEEEVVEVTSIPHNIKEVIAKVHHTPINNLLRSSYYLVATT